VLYQKRIRSIEEVGLFYILHISFGESGRKPIEEVVQTDDDKTD